jgi:hypothetical protein
MTLESSRIRALALNLPMIAGGEPIPVAAIIGLPLGIEGAFGLFEIRVHSGLVSGARHIRVPIARRRFLGVFVDEQDRVFLPTARHIWDAIQTSEVKIEDSLEPLVSEDFHARLVDAAKQAGEHAFSDLRQEHLDAIDREVERGTTAMTARRRAIERVGLAEVRQHRLKRCDAEDAEWRREVADARQIVPEIRPILLMRVTGARAS